LNKGEESLVYSTAKDLPERMASKPSSQCNPPETGDPDDALLVAQAVKGSADAFEYLVKRYRNQVYAMCYHITRNREEAWDLAQEVFVKAHRALGTFRGESGFKPWLLRIAANHAKHFLKRRRLETVAFDDARAADAPAGTEAPDRAVELRELGAAINRALDQLPEKHRTAFILREYEGLSYQEMAEAMECSLGTVMSRLFHARRKLQELLHRAGVTREGLT